MGLVVRNGVRVILGMLLWYQSCHFVTSQAGKAFRALLEKKGEQPPDNETMNIGHVIQLGSLDVFKMLADYIMVHQTERGEVLHTNIDIKRCIRRACTGARNGSASTMSRCASARGARGVGRAA